eukprot:jgi/Chlat1/7388/Chrsp6S07418
MLASASAAAVTAPPRCLRSSWLGERQLRPGPGVRRPCGWRPRAAVRWETRAAMEALDHNLLGSLLQHPFLGVGVGLPCTVMDCGDVVYRSTLQQNSGPTITPTGVALLGLLLAYLMSTPGVLPGFLDLLLAAPLDRVLRPPGRLKKSDFTLEKKLGQGAFGTVWSAVPSTKAAKDALGGDDVMAVLKRASQFGWAEAWMNRRVRRACPNTCALFVDFFPDREGDDPEAKDGGPLWLVWRYEGSSTLFDAMQKRDFPYCMEEIVLGRSLDGELDPGAARASIVVKAMLRTLLKSLASLHREGIVHRDVKPQNVVLAKDGTLKLIDLGAAADLRTGVNYVPNEFLLDPRYAAPEQYIMDQQTPSAPPLPIAALLSPVLWQLNLPDRFDMYSIGILFMQLAFPSLRSDNNLIAFNRQLGNLNYDLDAWREKVDRGRVSADTRLGFEIMDADDGAGWELVKQMVRLRARTRISASRALLHPFMTGGLPALALLNAASFQGDLFDAGTASLLTARMIGQEAAGLTENELAELQEDKAPLQRAARFMRGTIAKIGRKARKTAAETRRPGGLLNLFRKASS